MVKNKRDGKNRGFGFVSFKDPDDFIKAMKEMNGKYIGNRPVKLRKSTYKDRDIGVARKKAKHKVKNLGQAAVKTLHQKSRPAQFA